MLSKDLPAERLVKGRGLKEYLRHLGHLGYIPDDEGVGP